MNVFVAYLRAGIEKISGETGGRRVTLYIQ